MKVTISWRDAAKFKYSNTHGCPLWVALDKLGLPVIAVGGSGVSIGTGFGQPITHYYFQWEPEPWVGVGRFGVPHSKVRAPKASWNDQTARWCARRHRSFTLEIPGLEAEFDEVGKVKVQS